MPQGLLRRNRVELRKSHEAPIKVEDDDVIEARKQSSTETREDTREQAPPDTRVETFDQPCDPLSSVPDAPKSPSPLQHSYFTGHATTTTNSILANVSLGKKTSDSRSLKVEA